MKNFNKMNSPLKALVLGITLLLAIGCEKSTSELEDSKTNNTALNDGVNSKIQKELTTNTNNFDGISVRNGVLTFNSLDSYESVVEKESNDVNSEKLTRHLSSLSFKNYSKSIDEKSDFDDPFMDAIMNEDKIVKIGPWYIHIDIPTETVLAISEKEENAYKTLVNKKGKSILKFSTGDDVLDHLFKEKSLFNKGCGGIGGGVYPSYNNVYQGQIIRTQKNGVVWRLNPFVRFFRAGIYFKLSSQYEIWRFPTAWSTSGGQIVTNISSSNIEIQMFVKWSQGWWKKRPCRPSSVGTLSPGYHYSQSVYGNYAKTVYSGIRNLNGYYLYVQGRAKYPNGTYTIASPYGGRNINSPY